MAGRTKEQSTDRPATRAASARNGSGTKTAAKKTTNGRHTKAKASGANGSNGSNGSGGLKETTKKKVGAVVPEATPSELKTVAPSLPVRSDEDAWTPEELRAIHAELDADAVRLRSEIAEADSDFADLLWSPGDGTGDDQADAGSKTFEREHEMSLAANARDMLAQTERAILRIADGAYGSCERCGAAIGKARLQAYPRATLCVSCKQREERH